jgi:hypothetical protein
MANGYKSFCHRLSLDVCIYFTLSKPHAVTSTLDDMERDSTFARARHTGQHVLDNERELRRLYVAGETRELLALAIPSPWNMMFSGDMGRRKAQPDDAKVPTPTGFRAIGDLSMGSMIVIPDGARVPVIGIYPQGEKEIYRVTFSRWALNRVLR